MPVTRKNGHLQVLGIDGIRFSDYEFLLTFHHPDSKIRDRQDVWKFAASEPRLFFYMAQWAIDPPA
jgi:hypothetical protein